MIMWIVEHFSIIGSVVMGLIVIIGGAFGLGHSKGKTSAETAAKLDKVEEEKQAIQSIAERQTTVTTEAKNVQENVNRMSDPDVDNELLSKYSYPADKDGGS
ncbi:hypothetical protein [Sodalis sp. RH22]|uniref:hypothetical protein n=1 Tax=unclassified Sodalis (in: enterobacteria) TaxID=2636512 RepID=UPI0039B42394